MKQYFKPVLLSGLDVDDNDPIHGNASQFGPPTQDDDPPENPNSEVGRALTSMVDLPVATEEVEVDN